MLDRRFVSENWELVARMLAARGQRIEDLANLLGQATLDFEGLALRRRELIARRDTLKHEHRKLSEDVGREMKAIREAARGVEITPSVALRHQAAALGDEIATLETELALAEELVDRILMYLPNLPDESVPLGREAADNVELRRVGEPRAFDFEPRAHWELGPELGILDFERAAKLSGARFTVYWDLGARLERALTQLMLDLHTQERGYREVLPPYLVTAETLTGTGQLPKFEGDLFKTQAGERPLYLIPTAEVPVTNLHRDEILDEESLPRQYVAFTPCFRSEAGSYGKDVRGLIRQHQFHKVELVRLTTPETSMAALDGMLLDAEEVLKRLELPYRVVTLCTGDMGFQAAKTYDIEVWLPGEKSYREISSVSNCTDFQARRASLRYRPAGGKGKPRFLHTLNGSGLAVGRTLIAVLENYQQRDGSVLVPQALRSYLGGLERIEKRR